MPDGPDFSQYTPETQATLEVLTHAIIVAKLHKESVTAVATEPHDFAALSANQMQLTLALDLLVVYVERANELRKARRN